MEPTLGLEGVALLAGKPIDRVGQWARDGLIGPEL